MKLQIQEGNDAYLHAQGRRGVNSVASSGTAHGRGRRGLVGDDDVVGAMMA
jgi:hypothetical protein